MALHRHDCIGYKQHVKVMMCKSFSELCSIHQSPVDAEWFIMGQYLLRTAPIATFRRKETELEGPVTFLPDCVVLCVDHRSSVPADSELSLAH
jgi:hypothetical protein